MGFVRGVHKTHTSKGLNEWNSDIKLLLNKIVQLLLQYYSESFKYIDVTRLGR